MNQSLRNFRIRNHTIITLGIILTVLSPFVTMTSCKPKPQAPAIPQVQRHQPHKAIVEAREVEIKFLRDGRVGFVAPNKAWHWLYQQDGSIYTAGRAGIKDHVWPEGSLWVSTNAPIAQLPPTPSELEGAESEKSGIIFAMDGGLANDAQVQAERDAQTEDEALTHLENVQQEEYNFWRGTPPPSTPTPTTTPAPTPLENGLEPFNP